MWLRAVARESVREMQVDVDEAQNMREERRLVERGKWREGNAVSRTVNRVRCLLFPSMLALSDCSPSHCDKRAQSIVHSLFGRECFRDLGCEQTQVRAAKIVFQVFPTHPCAQ